MSVTVTWKIDEMRTLDTPQSGFVVSVRWVCHGTDGTHTGETHGRSYFKSEGDSFTPYDQLTEEQVLQWVFADIGEAGKNNQEVAIRDQINAKANPPVSPSAQPLPWGN